MISENDVLNSRILSFDIYPLEDGLEGLALGNNTQGVLVLALCGEREAEESFLRKILGAVQLDLDRDTAYLLFTTKAIISSAPLIKRFDATRVFLFGLSAAQCGLSLLLQPFTPLVHSGITYLHAPSLTEISRSQSHKKQLWAALQELFPKGDASNS